MTTPVLMSYEYLLQSAAATKARTDNELSGFVERFPKAIDVLLKLPHWTGPEPAEQPSYYHHWAMSSYLNAGYSFAAMFRDWRTGFYLDAQILQRHLYEVLVQLVHLPTLTRDRIEEHFIPAELIAHRKSGAKDAPTLIRLEKPNTVSFRKMFEAQAPGYYDLWYSMASIFSHGRMGADLFRVDHRTTPPQVTMGLQYNDGSASFVLIQSVAVMRGFLGRFPDAFPAWNAAQGGALRDEAIASMDEFLLVQWKSLPSSRDWLGLVAPLIGWKVPTP